MPKLFERISTVVPWPRGITIIGKTAYVLARGIPRRPRGPHPFVFDRAGTIFAVDITVAEPVKSRVSESARVRANGKVFATPDPKVFKLWGHDDTVIAPWEDIQTDRPYATLVRDAKSRNFFICGFSGIDTAPKSNKSNFRKNATDAILRYDDRHKKWHEVERHQAERVPDFDRKNPNAVWFGNNYYPNHSAKPPYGWLNGPDGLHVFRKYLLAVAKDNNVLVRYSLDRIRKSPNARHPQSKVIFEGKSVKTVDGKRVHIGGYSSIVTHGGMIYLGGRDKNLVVRMPINEDAEIDASAVELVADFGKGTNLIDLAVNSTGHLFASTASYLVKPEESSGAIWKIATSSRGRAFRPKKPWFSKLGGKCSNIAFDNQDRLYVCTNNDDIGGEEPHTAGVIYRITEA